LEATVAQRGLGLWQRTAVVIALPLLKMWTRRTWTGLENLPPAGGVILAPNHMSHFDPLVVAHFAYGAGRWPRFLAKASLWDVPVVGFFLRKTLQIPVERGSVEAVKSLDALVTALREGGAVIIYPEGTTTKNPDLWPMRGKTGAARLGLLTGAPIIPIAHWGAQQIFDARTGRLSVRPRRPVSVVAGKPIDLSRWEGAVPSRAVLDEITDVIMTAVRDLLAEVRGAEPPPLHPAPVRRPDPPEAAGSAEPPAVAG
jgi:1-acyl-sn-glycerol-3-phosphate acyltransferase